MPGAQRDREELSLAEAVQYLLDETRMVLPGIQALFGFQLVSVFSERFTELSQFHQQLHFAAITLVVISIALVMTPAAYHRHQEVFEVTHTFVVASTRLLLLAMAPLAVALCLDFYLIAQFIVDGPWAHAFSVLLFAVLVFFWEIFPRSRRLHRALAF
jgi:uncharacterized membrane protein